jgi:Tol biopolymer transport system component
MKPMRSMRILPLLAVVLLPGCDTAGEWVRGHGATMAHAAPLTSDTSVVTIRRVWSSAPDVRSNILDLSSPMPDGAGIAMTEWPTGDPAIFDLATREFRRLRVNDIPYDRGLALKTLASPDGSQIVLLWMNQRPDEWEGLRVVDVATGASRMIMTRDTATEGQPWPVAWTPAGDSVFALLYGRNYRSGAQVVIVPVAGGTPRLIRSIPAGVGALHVSLSPDGRWLLYDHEISRTEQTRSDIYIIDVQGGGARPLVEHTGLDALVGWLPGTDVVLFSSDRSGTTDLWSVRVANGRTSGEPRLVRSGFFRSQAIGFADGALFYRVTTGSSGQAVINMDPRSGALIDTASPPLLNAGPLQTQAWSPDGQTLAAITSGQSVTIHSMENGDSRKFWLEGDVHAFRMEWAADGQALFLRVGEAGGMVPTGPHHFLRLDLVTGITTRLFAEEDPEDISSIWRFLATPDGRSIILRKQHTLDDGRTEMNLVLRSLEDGSESVLYRTSDFIPEFSISADGTRLAFVQQAWEKSDSLFVMRMDGSQPLQAVTSWDYDAISLLGWLPAGNALLASRLSGPYSGRAEDKPGEEILRIELDGSLTVVGMSPFPPVRGARVQGYHRTRLVLSPVGNRLAHHISDSGEELWRMDGLHELFASDTTGRR